MGAITKTLYETDFVAWADEMAAALRAGRIQDLDLENLAEEIEALGRAERKAMQSQVERMMLHLLKRRLQPERDIRSWGLSIGNARIEIRKEIRDTPSLRRFLEENLEQAYQVAVEKTLLETGKDKSPPQMPARCPWTLKQLLESDIDALR
jgi:hypothetical protein